MSAPTLESLQAQISALQSQHADTHRALQSSSLGTGDANSFYLMICGVLVFFMQAGFALLEAGSVRSKNAKNILMKNLLDACIGAIIWWAWGYGVAYEGGSPGDDTGFIGGTKSGGTFKTSNFFAAGYNTGSTTGGLYAAWWFQYVFAAAAATIVSGAMAERTTLIGYLVYTVVITGFIYPVVVHWVWDGAGFMSAANKDAMGSGSIDFAGSGVVHMTGGVAAFVGAKVLGPRIGRWENPAAFDGHSTPLQVIGTFLLWFGWYGFNPGSTLALHGVAKDAARAAVTTTLSAAAGGITGLFIKKFFPAKLGGTKCWDIAHTCNSLLGGLVGITAGCSVITPQHAILTGMISALVYHMGSCMMRKLKIDDPLDAFAVHGACGFWGCIAVGLFALKEYSYAPAEGSEYRLAKDGVSDLGPDAGLFMPGTRGVLFWTMLVCCIIQMAWVGILSTIMFVTLKCAGIFRVGEVEEAAGMDESKHGGSAYPTTTASSSAGYPTSTSSSSS